MKILIPRNKFLHGNILPSDPLPPTHPHPNAQKGPENVCTHHNNH